MPNLDLDHLEHKSSESPDPFTKIQKQLPREQQSSIVFGDDGDAEEKKKQFGKRRVANPPVIVSNHREGNHLYSLVK